MAGDDGGASTRDDSPRVLCDAMCGKLATYLRMCGYDAAYALDEGIEDDDRLASRSAAEGRLLITRDRELAARVDDALRLGERDVLDQLRAVADAGYPVELASEPSRCGSCNGPLERVDDGGRIPDGIDPPAYAPAPDGDADDDADRVESDAPRRFWRCRDCGRWFWKGSHWERVADRIADL
jgi:uncharacterized protein with PIN domain